MHKRALVAILILSLLMGGFAFTPAVQAAPTSAEIDSLQQQASAAQGKLDALSTEMESASEDYYQAQTKTEKTKQQIVKTEQELAVSQEKLSSYQGQLNLRAEATYRNGDDSFLNIVLGASSFQDFLTRFDYIMRVSQKDAELIQNVRAAKSTIEHTKYTLEQQKAAEEKQQQVELDNLTRVQGLIATQKTYVGSLNTQVKDALAARQKALAEEARRRAAAAAAKAAAEAAAQRDREQSGTGASSGGGSDGGGSDGGGYGSGALLRKFDPSVLGAAHPEVVTIARKYLGIPYVWGGTTPNGFDCSGLVMYCYRQIGISLPRTSREQYWVGAYIPATRRDLLKPGDLLFFATDVSDPSTIHHVTIYSGHGMMIEAPYTGANVREVSSYRSGFIGAVRP
ncbi:MAG: NlpC/P60 family protein [Coriobacteriia bacterium]|nr:NlpC/P60 family protein [Coriobacteriia bacterium]